MSRSAVATLVLMLVAAVVACVAPANVEEGAAAVPLGIDTVMCAAEGDCEATCGAVEERARAERPAPTYATSRCELVSLVTAGAPAAPTPSCLCFADGQTEPAVVLSPSHPDSCLVYGRDRSCLLRTASLSPCDVDRPDTSCEDACRELERREATDTLRRVNVRRRAVACAQTGCRCVLDINDVCYVDDWVDAFDCRDTDEQILRTFDAMIR